jgi:hypothetical protein
MAADATVPNNFTVGTPAVADDVDANFSAIVNWINTNAVHLDASKAFSSVPSGPTGIDPTTDNQLTRKAYVDARIPFSTLFRVRLARATALVVTSGSPLGVTWLTESADPNNFWTTGTNLTVPSGGTGLYAWGISSTVDVATATTWRFVDGSGNSLTAGTTGSVLTAQRASGTIVLAAGDVFGIRIEHSAGANRSFSNTTLYMVRVSD